MRVQFHPGVVITALLPVFAFNASAQANMTVAIDNLCSFESSSWTMNQSDPNLVGPGAPTAGGGKPATGPVTVTKYVDSCSPKLYVAAATQQQFAQVTFTASKTSQPMLTLTKVVITAVQQAGASSSKAPYPDPTESLTFAFVSFSTQETAGSSAGETTTNVSLSSPSCQFSALTWSIGVTNPTTPGNTKSQPTSLALTKSFDSCSQTILKAVHSGTLIPSLVLTVSKTPGTVRPITWLTITLTNVVPVSYAVAETSGSGGATTNETASFLYGAISIQEISMNPDGSLGTSTIDGFNFTTQKVQ